MYIFLFCCCVGCWLRRCIYIVFFIPFAAARRLVLSKEPFSRGTTRQIAHERLWLLQLHVNYNFIESIWCIIYCHPRSLLSPNGRRERTRRQHTQQLLSLCFFISNRTLLWISNFSTNNKSSIYIICVRTQNARSDAFSNTRSHTSHKKEYSRS